MEAGRIVPIHVVSLDDTADYNVEYTIIVSYCGSPNTSRLSTNRHQIRRHVDLGVFGYDIANLLPVDQIFRSIDWDARKSKEGRGDEIEDAIHEAD